MPETPTAAVARAPEVKNGRPKSFTLPAQAIAQALDPQSMAKASADGRYTAAAPGASAAFPGTVTTSVAQAERPQMPHAHGMAMPGMQPGANRPQMPPGLHPHGGAVPQGAPPVAAAAAPPQPTSTPGGGAPFPIPTQGAMPWHGNMPTPQVGTPPTGPAPAAAWNPASMQSGAQPQGATGFGQKALAQRNAVLDLKSRQNGQAAPAPA